MELKKEFYSVLKKDFIPLLKAEGFSGAGSNFRKVSDQVAHTVNIQNNRHGASCCVNLGINLAFLPNTKTQSIKEIDCEFRVRLAPKGCVDFWWEFSGLSQSVEHLCSTYRAEGAEFFREYETIKSIELELASTNFQHGEFNKNLGVTSVRASLILAYIYQYQGNSEQQRHYASIGLKNIGKATALKLEFEALLKNT